MPADRAASPAQEATPPRPNALTEAEVHLGELADGPKGGRPDYMGFLSLADAVALRDELSRLRLRVAVLSSGAAPTPEATTPREWRTEMTGWLIEMPQSTGAEFWCGVNHYDRHEQSRPEHLWAAWFRPDANQAVRFRSEQDAKAVMRLFPAEWGIQDRVYAAEHRWLAPEATGAPEPDCLTAGDGSCIDPRPCIHTPRDDANDRADELDGYASLTTEDRDWVEHLITTDGDWIPGVPEKLLRRYEATLVRLEATVAALTADRDAMWQEREGWKTTAAQRGFEVLALRHRLGLPPHDPPQSD